MKTIEEKMDSETMAIYRAIKKTGRYEREDGLVIIDQRWLTEKQGSLEKSQELSGLGKNYIDATIADLFAYQNDGIGNCDILGFDTIQEVLDKYGLNDDNCE